MDDPNKKLPNSTSVYLLILIVFFAVICIFYLFKSNLNKRYGPPSPTKSITKSVDLGLNKTNDFFLSGIPRPLDRLEVYQLPNSSSPASVIEYNNSLWISGNGSILEYDKETLQLIRYSNPLEANCTRDMVLINGYIYAACMIDNIEDAFGNPRQLDTVLFTGHFGILKINPVTHTLERIFSHEDGLLNGYNYELHADGNNLWIETFNGVGRIDTNTDKVFFYREELGDPHLNDSYSINHILIDTDHVWVFFSAHAEAEGGTAYFTKSTNTWRRFGLTDLKEYPDRFDLDSYNGAYLAKTTPEGINIVFRDGTLGDTARVVEKQYSYESDEWKVVNQYPATGNQFTNTFEKLSSSYPKKTELHHRDEQGLTQLNLTNNRTGHFDGRDNYILSPYIGGKRYVLTNTTIDVIDDTQSFSNILVRLGQSQFLEASDYSYNYEPDHYFFVDPDSLISIVINSSCGGMGCDGGQKLWLIDLKAAVVKKIYQGDELPTGEQLLEKLTFHVIDNYIVAVNEKQEEVFRVNLTDNNLTYRKL